MSIQEWAAIAEIVGALAVVASLVYLAVQIRQNTRSERTLDQLVSPAAAESA